VWGNKGGNLNAGSFCSEREKNKKKKKKKKKNHRSDTEPR
jgi:hypothetical protein